MKSHLFPFFRLALLLILSAAASHAAEPLHYNRDIRPILTENCFACHGPDRNKRQANLRLDMATKEVFARGILTAGRPERSKLIARIFARDSDPLRMPPVSTRKSLTPAQKNLLRRWIAEGAKYERHWAFVPVPSRVAVPPVKNRAWPRNAMDRFILARLEREKLSPSREATKAEWLRRAALDITGIPPTIAETDAFLADRAPDSYARAADRLLNSPLYGERMAVSWLDLARYADSYGYQSDQLCTTWPFRDWVARAFNQNMPYDRFLTWQLAGDLLPGATREQRLATAFNRLHRMTNEGGSVPEEWRMEGVADRVRTFGTAFLGLTLECARCHDHKYDPVSQREYYALSAFFNSIDEHGLYDQAHITPTPSLLLPTPEQEKQLVAARNAAVLKTQALAEMRLTREAALQAWARNPEKPHLLPDLVGYFDFERFDGTTLPNRAPGATKNGARSEEVPLVEGRTGKAILLDGENNVNFPELGRFERHTPFTLAFWLRDARQTQGATVVFQACGGTDTGPYGYDLVIEEGRLMARLMRHWPGNAIAVRAKPVVPKEVWTHVAVTYDGSSQASGLKIYLDGRLAEQEIVRDKLYKGIEQHTLVFGQRFRDRGLKGGRIDDLYLFARDLTPLEVAQIYDGQQLLQAITELPAKDPDILLRDYYFSAIDPETRKAAQELASARQKAVEAENAQQEVMVMEEMSKLRPAYALARGAYDSPKSEANRVSRITPAILPPLPAGAPRDRLGLARWLTRPDHPLTARVEVNRIWGLFFGRGLVETAEDFGIQGRLPTHPELLDWLARDFIQSGWNVRALIEKIVLSSAYRQASAIRPELRERDPQNLLLARGPHYRLKAETIRDMALAASSLLDRKMGGPPVSPYQPGDLWRESNSMSPAYRQSVGTDLYRRSLYTVWKRTAPMPNMIAFDAGSREVCIARRQNTNTPLQALVLLNDPQFVEAARVIGARALKEGGATAKARARFTFRLLATREPTAAELNILTRLYEEQRALYEKEKEQGAKLTRIGDSKPDPTLLPAELAAATVLAQAVLNLDATIWKR